jgi:hypothetical protein
MPITTWPPVTLEKEVLVRRVGMNCADVVKALAGTEPLRTWYWRRAVIIEGSFSRAYGFQSSGLVLVVLMCDLGIKE